MEAILIVILILSVCAFLAIFADTAICAYYFTIFLMFISTVLMIVCLVWVVEETIFDAGLFNDSYEKRNVTIQALSENYYSYRAYYISGENVESIYLPKDVVKIETFKSYNDKMSVDLYLHRSRNGHIIDDDESKATFYLPEGYRVLNEHQDFEVNDLKQRRVIQNECINEMRYDSGKYSFYVLDRFLKQIDFQEQGNVRVLFKKGDTRGHKACLNFDYYETYNHKLINKKGHTPVYEIIVSEDFDLTTLKR
jgi:hypothetical protein